MISCRRRSTDGLWKLGPRIRGGEERRALARESVLVETAFGPIDVKVAYSNGSVKAMPEFEQCRVAATKSGVALREVQEAASTAYRNKTAGAGKP